MGWMHLTAEKSHGGQTSVDESVTGFWQISVLRAKPASMTAFTEVTGDGMSEDELAAQSTRRRIIVRLHGSRSQSTDET